MAFILADDRTADVVDDLVGRSEEEAMVIEREWYGFDHAELGAVLAQDWGLASEQCDAIQDHHHPTHGGLAAIVNAADAIAYALGTGGVRQPASVSCASLGLSADDEVTCIERARAALAEYRDVLG